MIIYNPKLKGTLILGVNWDKIVKHILYVIKQSNPQKANDNIIHVQLKGTQNLLHVVWIVLKMGLKKSWKGNYMVK